MTNTAEAGGAKRKRKQFGRHGKPHRIDGLDLRTSAGRRYSAHFRALVAEFGDADIPRLKEVAAHRATLEQMQIEALGLDYWKAAKARDGIVSLARLISKQETVLRAAKEAKAAEPQKPQTLADFLANRPKAAVDA